MGVLAGILVAIGLWRTWLPVRLEIGAMGVTRTVLGRERRIPWSAIARTSRLTSGVMVFPEMESTPLEALRGFWIPFGRQRDEVLAILDFYLAGRNETPSQDCQH